MDNYIYLKNLRDGKSTLEQKFLMVIIYMFYLRLAATSYFHCLMAGKITSDCLPITIELTIGSLLKEKKISLDKIPGLLL